MKDGFLLGFYAGFIIGGIAEILHAHLHKWLDKREKKNVDDKDPDDELLTYYTTRCTSCGKVAPVGDYCIWCGEKGTCLEGGDKNV